MTTSDVTHSAGEWLAIVRAEYEESPGLNLTRGQVRRLRGLDAQTADTVLQALERAQFLRKTDQDMYVRTGSCS